VTHATQFRWTSASRSDVGLVRQINEDAYLDRPERGLWAVADGMGGHAHGDFASRMVIEALNKLPSPDSLVELVSDARDRLLAVNLQLRAEAVIRDVPIIGSTVVALFARDRYCGYLWAGDSRVYLCRNGSLRLLTRDHSQIEELKSRGNLSPESATHLSARNLITRAVGAMDTLELEEETMEVRDGDMFLLCSDGLSNAVSDPEMRGALVPGNCRLASDALVNMALTQGGRDNISVVVLRAEDPDSNDKTVLNPAL
jgi:protein phosphatase